MAVWEAGGQAKPKSDQLECCVFKNIFQASIFWNTYKSRYT